MGVLGVVLMSGGGYFYFASPKVPASQPIEDFKTPRIPDLKLDEKKNLDLKEEKKVKELREKLSKQSPDSKRRTMLRVFETPESSDKDLPAGVEKTDVELLPKLKPKRVNKKIFSKLGNDSSGKRSKRSEKDHKDPEDSSEEYIPIEKLKKKKKDLFDELEDL